MLKTQLTLLVTVLCLGLLAGCGDSGSGGSDGPSIGIIAVECSPAPEDSRFDGDIISSIEAPVSGSEISAVTASILASVLVLTADGVSESGDTKYVYVQGDDTNSLIPCDAGTQITVRAVDVSGSVATEVSTVE